MNHQKIQFFLQNISADCINWHSNPPASGHMGGVWERQIWLACTILMSLLHTDGWSLNDESLRTLLVGTEAIVNSSPFMVDMLGDVQSKQPICPSKMFTMKSKVVLPPPGHFVTADEYSRKRWRHIQHITYEFWVRWQKEFLWSLRSHHKWSKKLTNFQNGDVVLLKTDAYHNHGLWQR